jgi:hypothetical protein
MITHTRLTEVQLYRVIHLLPPLAKLTLKIMISLSYFADLIYYP